MEKNQRNIFGARLCIIVLLAVAGWALVEKTGVANSDEAGIVLALPPQVGPWQGVNVMFCPDAACGGNYTGVEEGALCPKCGQPLQAMNYAEQRMLPADTGLVRNYYIAEDQPPLQVTIVLSGNDRSSIHRPQVCMTANGFEIMEERRILVPLKGRSEPLEIMVLDMSRTEEDGRQSLVYYAYWFVGKGRETASHVQRMVWMASDRILHGVSHRWAYIALSGGRAPEGDAHLQLIANFASGLHPALLKPEATDGPASAERPEAPSASSPNTEENEK